MDACAVNLMRPAMYGAYHHITVLGKENEPWKAAMNKAADQFFQQSYDQSGISAYTGRTE